MGDQSDDTASAAAIAPLHIHVEGVLEDSEEENDLSTPRADAAMPEESFSPSKSAPGNQFASHRFYGPSKGDPHVKVLHGIRRVDVQCKNPKFLSDALHVAPPENSLVGDSNLQEHVYAVTFTDENLGFTTNVVVNENGKMKVKVIAVEQNSASQRAGVVQGDCLLSINSQAIEPHMTESEVTTMIATAPNPKTMLFLRYCEKGKDAGPSVRKSFLDFGTTSHFGGLKSLLGMKRKEVNEDSFCDGCGMNPIKGTMWTCSVCINFNLCNGCYEQGAHGMENTESMQMLNEAIVQEKLKKQCKQLTPEFLLSLRRDICKGRIDRFEYMGKWLADIIGNTPAHKITVRGIEIPYLSPNSRQRFVSMLMPLASNRTDIEVNIEWLPHAKEDDAEPGDEKLRIWFSDKNLRTKSPFATVSSADTTKSVE